MFGKSSSGFFGTWPWWPRTTLAAAPPPLSCTLSSGRQKALSNYLCSALAAASPPLHLCVQPIFAKTWRSPTATTVASSIRGGSISRKETGPSTSFLLFLLGIIFTEKNTTPFYNTIYTSQPSRELLFMLSDEEFDYFCDDNVKSYIFFCNFYRIFFSLTCDIFSTKI